MEACNSTLGSGVRFLRGSCIGLSKGQSLTIHIIRNPLVLNGSFSFTPGTTSYFASKNKKKIMLKLDKPQKKYLVPFCDSGVLNRIYTANSRLSWRYTYYENNFCVYIIESSSSS